jgi:HEAT repeat protein
MGPTRRRRNSAGRTPLAAVALVLAAGLGAPSARAQPPAGDPVERLRAVLKAPSYDAAARDQALQECLAGLRSLGDLGRAAGLVEWRDQGDGPIVAVDQRRRAALVERLGAGVRDVLRRGDSTASQVAIDLLTELGRAARARGDRRGLARDFAPDLAQSAGDPSPRVRAASARALGQIDAAPNVALPALARLVQDAEPDVRRAAAEGLNGLLQSATEAVVLAGGDAQTPGDRRAAVEAAAGVVRAARPGLIDPFPEVRRECLRALAGGGGVLGRLISDPPRLDQLEAPERAEAARRLEADAEEVRPLALALREQADVLAARLSDRDAEARLQAHKAFEEEAQARARWLRSRAAAGATADDPLAAAAQAALRALASSPGDADVRVRRCAVDALEWLGPAAAPAVPALTRALADPDRFVRWSAARTLGGVGPAARSALPSLTRLLDDPDLDIRLAAAAALERLGPRDPPPTRGGSQWAVGSAPPSQTALPALVRSLRAGDVGLRVASLHTLRGMGLEARPALAAIGEALADPDPRVRQAAAETLGALGPAARSALEPLRQAFNDPVPEVRRAAGDALLEVGRP